ncbi:MAG: metallophosphoesterase [Oscillospiraceae bacterium]|nr:metallophosphoesterase [Oscillospiraceae bacterium]
MIYVMSDIHGCYEKYRAMLEVIQFAEDDTLYVLGDVLDRGPDGFKILLDMAARPNVAGLLGNHELLAAAVLPLLLRTMRQGEEQPLSKTEQEQMQEWIQNGGKPSILQFLQLGGEEMEIVCTYLWSLSAYEEVVLKGQQFVLVHAGLEHFSIARPLAEYDLEDFLFCRPNLDTTYFPDKTLVFGHTPTRLLYRQIGGPEQPDRMFHRGTIIGIDCGCAYPGGRLGCLCLDTMEEFYV